MGGGLTMSRLGSESVCIKCGGIILELNPNLKMCSQCEKDVCKKATIMIDHRKEDPKGKRYKLKIGKLHGIKLSSKR